jgi:prolyl oligopeptidase
MTARDYPGADRLDLTEIVHGHPIADPYRWLEDMADPRTDAWRAAQEALFRQEQATWPHRERLAARLTELFTFDIDTLPRPRGDRMFLARRGANQEHAVVFMLDRDGRETTLLDPMRIDPTGTTTLESWHPSIEGNLLTYQLSGGGREDGGLRVLDVASGRIVDGPIDRVRRSPVAWLPGGTAFYYVRRLPADAVPAGERQYHRRVYLHRVGEDPDSDVLIFGTGRDKADYYGVSVTVDGRWLVISAAAGTARRTDLWLADLSETGREDPKLRVVQAGVDARTVPYIRAGTEPDGPIPILTERNAEHGRLAITTPATMALGEWPDLVGEDPTAVMTDLAVLDEPGLNPPLAVVVRARHAVSEMSVHSLLDGHQVATVALPGKGWVRHVVDRAWGGHEAWFTYTDFATPLTIYGYDARTGSVRRLGRPTTPDVPKVHTQQVVYPSLDGTPVRMFVISSSGVADRPRPTILAGYGGFSFPMAPDYSPLTLAWVEAGGVYVVANIRGGGEEGEDWHRAAIRADKQKSFDDFAAAADWLIAEGWTTEAQLGMFGGSNGGLLVGAVLTQHPEKFAAAVCSAPLLDMVRYERFGLGPSWRAEFGTAEDRKQFEWLLSYSPYHRVRPGTAYPAMLFTVFDGDTRVDPLHARKMCAALQHASTSGRPILLRAEQGVGHGLRARSRAVELLVDTFTFFASQLGLTRAREGDLAGTNRVG